MGAFIDLTGNRYGRLLVLNRVLPKAYPIKWVCQCDCGETKEISRGNLTTGLTKSCGCLHREVTTKHGEATRGKRPPLYGVWASMRSRCNSQSDTAYGDYGGRGITVCPEWDDYEVFRDWALTNGYEPGLEVDRKKNHLGYSPENCRITTRSINCRNRRASKGSSSIYIGVHYYKRTGKWTAHIYIGKRIHLGYFATEIEAAKARDNYVRSNNLEGFTLNFEEETEPC